MYPRIERRELSFQGERLLRGRHKIHPYPAMLHPLLVDHLITKYAKEDDVVFDPFCGSGVTLLQSKISGHEAFGFDINPLALLIARAKTRTYQRKKLIAEAHDLHDTLAKKKDSAKHSHQTDVPPIKNIHYWYSQEVIRDLGRIRWVLKNKPYTYRDFFLAVFAFICRNQSFTRNGEFKRYRIKENKITETKNEVLPRFFSHLREMVNIFLQVDMSRKQCRPMLANSESKFPRDLMYDLVITSPPYGDSRTTVAYGQYTSFGAEWVNGVDAPIANGYKIDSESLGRKTRMNKNLGNYKILTETIAKIREVDDKRADEVLDFFNGYYQVVKNVVTNLNKGGRVCFVVGNRTVKGFQIPMDQITASFLDSMRMKFDGIFTREILNKVMPAKNSPTNQAGVKSKTMTNEYIVAFAKG